MTKTIDQLREDVNQAGREVRRSYDGPMAAYERAERRYQAASAALRAAVAGA